jgi:O-6-methylguanine DNA methyltransferase
VYTQGFLSPCGWLQIDATDEAITKVAFVTQGQPPSPGETQQGNQVTQQCIDELSAYFAKKLSSFSVPIAAHGTDFQHKVWRALSEIDYGTTCSYADIANRINNPKGVRAVGLANGKNPLAILVPCHRVIGKNGTLTGYAGGIERKAFLLHLEGALA